MMTVKKSLSATDKIKYALAIPLVCLMSFMLLINSSSFAQDKKAYQEVDEFPEYPGGKSEMYKFIGSNIQYPKLARQIGVEARVYVSFVVNTDGKVEEVKAMKKQLLKNTLEEMVVVGYDQSSTDHTIELHKGMKAITAEAVRVVKLMPKFSPGKKDGKKVNTKMVLPINFTLNRNKK